MVHIQKRNGAVSRTGCSPHRNLQLLGIYCARAICVEEIKGFPAEQQLMSAPGMV